MLDFLKPILARLFDKFKADNPVIYAFIMLALMTAKFVIANGLDLGAFEITPVLGQAQQWLDMVLLFIASIMGTRTVRFIAPPQPPSLPDDDLKDLKL